MEKFMKQQPQEPYVIQSVRLTIGSFFFSILFLFVMGWVGEAESPQRLDFAFWHYRPTQKHCQLLGACNALGVFEFNSTDKAFPSCMCSRGVFVGWGAQWYVYGALVSG